MKSVHLDFQNSKSIEGVARVAATILKGEGIIVYPTDTVYGLGANALDEEAVEKIFRIKDRAKQKPISVAVKDLEMARRIAVASPAAEKFLSRAWPGAVTVILPKRSVVPDILTDGRPIGLRCFKNVFLDALFKLIDFPITATSANISGDFPISDIKDLREQFKNKKKLPDLIIDAGSLPQSPASTVVDLTTKEPKILRVGPVSPQDLLRLFNEARIQ